MRPVDYGVDAPGAVVTLFALGIFSLLLAAFAPPLPGGIWAPLAIGLSFVFTGSCMLLYSKVGKFGHRERILDMVSWRGDEQVLDIGTGRGLLLIGAAKKLQTGMSTGIDIWSSKDLSANSAAGALRNAQLEGVPEKVRVLAQDVQKMSFKDNTFDVILSNLVLHNIPSPAGRVKACEEIARVLKPNGVAVISDMKNTDVYATVFAEEGCYVEKHGPYFWKTFPPLTVLHVTKRDAVAAAE